MDDQHLDRHAPLAGATKSEVWLSMERVKQLTGWKESWVRRLGRQGRIRSRASAKIAANGKPVPEFLLSSLPPDPHLPRQSGMALDVLLSRAALLGKQCYLGGRK
jgi:hypothetical protein